MIVHVLRHIEQALVDAKQKLRFLRVTNNALGKCDPTFVVLGELATKGRADERRQPAAIDENLHARRDDVVLHRNPMRDVLGIEQTVTKLFEHFRQAFVKIQLRPEFF